MTASATISYSRTSRSFLVAAIVILTWCAPDAQAQPAAPHTVWLAPPARAKTDSTWYPRAITKQSGRVESFDSQFLSLRSSDANESNKIAASRVIRVESKDQSDAEKQALTTYLSQQHGAALVALIKALGSEDDPSDRPPVWRQQWLSMLAARAAWKSNRAKIAIELVSQLDRRPLAPMTIAELPVQWTRVSRERAAAATEAARSNLENTSPAVRFVCASWLLQSPTESERAEATLKALSVDKSRIEIAMLAETLRWRTAPPNEVTQRWREWESKIDRLPMVLQNGPLSSLVEKMETAGLRDQAQRIKLALEL